MNEIILIGGGEHARVVADAIRSMAHATLVGYVDPTSSPELEQRLGARYLGGDDALDAYPNAGLVLGVGALRVSARRAQIVASLERQPRSWAKVIHERAWVSPMARIEPGAVIMAGAIVQSGAVVGAHVIVNTGAIIEHDVVLGAFAQVGPGAVLGGGASVGEGAFVGLGARVRDHVTVGSRALVAMGAVVTRAVAEDSEVFGVPAAERAQQVVP